MRDNVRVAFALIEILLESRQHFPRPRTISVSLDRLKLIESTVLKHHAWSL